MSDTKETEEVKTTCPETPENNTRRNASIAAIIIGLLLIAAGVFSWFEDEDLNNSMIQVGAAQAVYAVVVNEPGSAAYALSAASIIEAAVEARTTSPDALVNRLCDASSAFVAPGTNKLLVAIIAHINSAHKSTDSEAVYLTKLLFLAKGIRDGCCLSDSGE